MAVLYKLFYLSCFFISIWGKFDIDGNWDDMSYLSSNPLGEARAVSSNMQRATNANMTSILPPEKYKIWPYIEDTSELTFNDCFPKVRPQQEGLFALIAADSGTEYRAQIVKKHEQKCFRDYYAFKMDMTLKKCLEFADLWDAPSFHFNKTTNYCQLYKDWKYSMYSMCRRGEDEEIFYTKNEEPDNHKPCRGVQMHFDGSYTADGSVKITGTTYRDYCGCDIDKITMYYLDTTVEFTIVPEIPLYTYTYPSASVQAWYNKTTLTTYARDVEVDITEYVPAWDFDGLKNTTTEIDDD